MPVAAVVFNPTSVRQHELRAAVDSAEHRAGWDRSIWIETTPGDSGRGAATRALAMSPDVVISVGGDGTVRAIATAVCRSTIPMVIVPTGTGNVLARNLRLPLGDLDQSVAAAFDGTDHVIDCVAVTLHDESGESSDHMFVAMAGIGLDAAMAHHSSARLKAVLGWLGYVPPIARSILSNRSFVLHSQIDGRSRKFSAAHTMIVGNCGVLTGDIVLMPGAAVDDGFFDVVVLRPGRLISWTPIGLRLVANGIVFRRRQRRGKPPRALSGSRTAYHNQATRFETTFDQAQLIELDGDAIGYVTRAEFELLPAALKIRTNPR